MKNIIYIASFLGLIIVGCDSESRISELADVGDKGAIPILTEDLSSSFKLSDVAGSEVSFAVEFFDTENGNSVASYDWNVAYTLIAGTDTTDLTAELATFNSFTPNADGIQSLDVTITMNEVLSALGITSNDVSEGDEFDFSGIIVLNDGRTFSSDNSNEGRLDALWGFDVNVDKETIVLDSWSSNVTYLGDGASDTLFLTFDTDVITAPTVARISSEGNTDDVVGAVTATTDDDVFYLIYEAGTAATDTISFMVSGAEAVVGFPMESETISVFITDNAAPGAELASISAQISMDSIASVSVEFSYGEVLSTDSIMYEVTSADFDDFMVKLPQSADSEMSSLTFTPMNGTAKLEEQQIEFDVTITAGTDLAGNEINSTFTGIILND